MNEAYIEKVSQKVVDFLYGNKQWPFHTGLMVLAVLLLLDNPNTEGHTFLNYFKILLPLELLFIPVFIFVSIREGLKEKLSGIKLAFIWVLVFIAYPLILAGLNTVEIFMHPKWDGWYIPVTAMVILLTELAFQSSSFINKSTKTFTWLKNIKLEKAILLGLIPFAFIMVMATTGVQSTLGTTSPLNRIPLVIWYTLQFYCLLFIYYIFYFVNHYILINKLFKEKGIVYFAAGFVATNVLLYPISAALIYQLPIVTDFMVHPVHARSFFNEINAWTPILGMVGTIPFILTYQWYRQNNKIVNLQKEKTQTELNLLKQQINPHFFFNTLNNLYALSLTKDQKTPEVIMQLSELMRYVIYKGKENQVPISEEVKYIEDYIQLQLIRLHKKVDFNFKKNIIDKSLQIPPLLFIVLIENAFKHGIEPAEGDCFLDLYLESDENSLTFSCRNSVEEKTKEAPGIGLDNLSRRLELLFPNNHELQIADLGNEFKTSLKIFSQSSTK